MYTQVDAGTAKLYNKSATDCAVSESKDIMEAVSRRHLNNIEKSGKKACLEGSVKKIFHTQERRIL